MNKFFRLLVCLLFKHKYRVKREITPETREVLCKRCKKEWGMNDNVKAFIPMDNELRRFHELLLKK